MTPQSNSFRRYLPAALLAAIFAGLVWAGQWAGKKNAERDAGITWVWAYSPRTMQTYLVRAVLDDDAGTLSFRLEGDRTYEFKDCDPPEGDDNAISCRDQSDLVWKLNL